MCKYVQNHMYAKSDKGHLTIFSGYWSPGLDISNCISRTTSRFLYSFW